jgi:ankyrin repeat protein
VKILDSIKFFGRRENLGGREMNINSKLIKACKEGNLSAVRKYVEKGADIHAWDGLALRWAAENGHLEIVKYLVEQGADIRVNNDWALRYAAYNGHLAIVKYLIEQGANIHARDDLALRWAAAAEGGHLQVVNYLRKAAGDKYKCHKCLIRSTCLGLCKDFRQY